MPRLSYVCASCNKYVSSWVEFTCSAPCVKHYCFNCYMSVLFDDMCICGSPSRSSMNVRCVCLQTVHNFVTTAIQYPK